MALGGYLYAGTVIWPVDAPYDTPKFEADANLLLTAFHTQAGWALHTGLTTYSSTANGISEYAISQYGGAANLGYVVWIFTMVLYDTFCDGTNHIRGVNQIGNPSAKGRVLVQLAYAPPGVALPGAGDPLTPNWLPAGCLKFQGTTNDGSTSDASNYAEWYDMFVYGRAVKFHLIAKGSTILILVENDYLTGTNIDQLYLAGDIITPAHAADTSGYAAIGHAEGSQTGGLLGVRFYQTLNTSGEVLTRYQGLNYVTDQTSLPALVNDRSPFNWVPVELVMSAEDLDTFGAIPGNGVKGFLNPEVYRYVRSGVFSDKQQLAGGNLIYLINGYVIGWDSSNGPLL